MKSLVLVVTFSAIIATQSGCSKSVAAKSAKDQNNPVLELKTNDAARDSGGKPASPADVRCWCNPAHPAILFNRIHVKCEKASGSDYCGSLYPNTPFFAFPTSDPMYKDMWLLMVACYTSAPNGQPPRGLYIHFDPNDTSGQSWGCLASDCRRIKWLETGP